MEAKEGLGKKNLITKEEHQFCKVKKIMFGMKMSNVRGSSSDRDIGKKNSHSFDECLLVHILPFVYPYS